MPERFRPDASKAPELERSLSPLVSELPIDPVNTHHEPWKRLTEVLTVALFGALGVGTLAIFVSRGDLTSDPHERCIISTFMGLVIWPAMMAAANLFRGLILRARSIERFMALPYARVSLSPNLLVACPQCEAQAPATSPRFVARCSECHTEYLLPFSFVVPNEHNLYRRVLRARSRNTSDDSGGQLQDRFFMVALGSVYVLHGVFHGVSLLALKTKVHLTGNIALSIMAFAIALVGLTLLQQRRG